VNRGICEGQNTHDKNRRKTLLIMSMHFRWDATESIAKGNKIKLDAGKSAEGKLTSALRNIGLHTLEI
jgi:hypothetical protein